MKGTLNWQSKEVVNIFDEFSIWSAPFGRLMLENIPMKANAKVLDIGFGTGFPLIELGQRFGEGSKVYGIDIWAEAILRAKEKIRVLQVENIEIFEQSAEQIPLAQNELDLICSNLGVNNFEKKEEVLKECHRVLKQGGSLCITTNPIGTFKELFQLFEKILTNLQLKKAQLEFQKYLAHRDTKDAIEKDISQIGFRLVKAISDQTNIRFVSAKALLNHALIRIGFLESWEQLIPKDQHCLFFENLIELIDQEIKKTGVFKMTIPMLYLEFQKI